MKFNIIDQKTLATLSQPETRRVLREVVKRKQIRLPELVDSGLTRDQALSATRELAKAHLIKARPGPIEDLSVFFVTADGLAADRQVAD